MSEIQQLPARLVGNTALTPTLYQAELEVEALPATMLPGQFIHVALPGMQAHILRRPFSVYYCDKSTSRIVLLYQVVGEGTAHFSRLSCGATLDVLGPIGTPWPTFAASDRVLLVMGGLGSAPLYMLAEQLVAAGVAVDVVMGAQTADALVALERYRKLLGKDPHLTTDDGSHGHQGFCSDILPELCDQQHFSAVCCCGPEPMMQSVSNITLARDIPTYISLEKRMACGVGACLSCVVETTQGNKRSCIDGPIFNAKEVVW